MTLLTASLPEGQLVSLDLVRDIHAFGNALVPVSTDRISAFGCVLTLGFNTNHSTVCPER